MQSTDFATLTPHSPTTAAPPSHGMISGPGVVGEFGEGFDAADHRRRVQLVLDASKRWRDAGGCPDTIRALEHRALTGLAREAHAAAPRAEVSSDTCTDCGGDTAYDFADFERYAACRCCCSCEEPDTASVDVHAADEGPDDVEPHCLTCALEEESRMLAGGWAPESFELRPLPSPMLRAGVAA